MKLIFHSKIMREYMFRLHEAYQEQKFLYKRIHAIEGSAPQAKYRPQGLSVDSPEYRLFLFFTTLMTYRSGSDAWFEKAVKMYKRHPEIFGKEILKCSLEDVQATLANAGLMHPEQGGRYWYISAKTLFSEQLQGDPLNLFRFDSVDSFMRYKDFLVKKSDGNYGLPGLGEKIYSLLAIFYEEIGALSFMPKGVFPVDLHVMRIAISLNAITGSGLFYASTVAPFLRKRISYICEREGYLALDMSHAMWFLGNSVCSRCSSVQGLDQICPIQHLCFGAIPSTEYRDIGRWNFDVVRKQKGNATPTLSLEGFEGDDYYLNLLLREPIRNIPQTRPDDFDDESTLVLKDPQEQLDESWHVPE